MSACHPHAEEMIELGRKLWGEPNRQRSTRSDIRFGSYGSKSIRLDKGEWYDHEAIEGGGYANLYFKVHGRYPEHNGQRSNIFQTYDYQDGNGRLLFQVVRKIPKDFRQRRPDGNGGWIWNLQGVERIPYRLPELLAAPLDATIYIAEGEKDVDNLRKHGLVATCNPGGAQEHKPGQPYRGKWKRSYSEFLRNRSVVILPDNDKTGEAHAQDVARKLNGIARTVRILNLPNLPSKGDVSDWFAAGGTAEELERLAGEMPEAEPQAAAAERDGPFAGATSVDELIAEFNEKYSVVNEAGKTIIYSRTHDPILNRRFYHRLGFADLRKLYMNRLIRVGTDKYSNPVMRTAADVWLRHRARRQYTDGIVFDPSGHPTPPGVLNLWSGFAYTPAPGDWSLLRAHICDVICSGCEEHFRYLMGWLARMVQHPGELGEVAVVMRGGEGCGKGTLGRVLRRLFGQHGIHVSQAKHLVGNFNAHLRDAIFLFADEAFFAGDKQHEGVLKFIITEEAIAIEPKGKDVILVPNYLHLIMASNKDWVVPASLDARRFFVLEVPDTVTGNRSYFDAIWKQMKAGGYAAMLHDLLHYDLTDFEVRDVPITEALQRQKKMTLPVAERWWLDVLQRGYVWKSKLGLEEPFSEWIAVVSTELLYESYREFAQRHHERHPMDRESFGRFMVRMKCTPTRRRGLVTGEHMEDHPEHGRRPKVLCRKSPANGYKLGALETARAGFIAATNLPIDWHDGASDEERADE